MNENDNNISDRFKELRNTLNLSSTEMAEICGYKGSTENAIESGINTAGEEYIDAVCKTYHVNKTWILSGTGTMLLDENGKQIEEVNRRNAYKRLKQLRKENQCTIEEFSKKTGVSKTAYWMIESGKRRISDRLAKKICSTCNVGAGWLLYGYEDEKEYPLDDAMIDYLKRHPGMRRFIRERMMCEGSIG